ncbi:tail fiber [Serratia phage vB_SmaM_Hera]|uniref:Tail fiber n=1 Tax=Serratia phage vB_SmaM_Hera TaxID=2777369 RepID=A0A7T3TKM7_9CAUD|nr:tail fiber [Serratia phage vB_SmaM_Hera]
MPSILINQPFAAAGDKSAVPTTDPNGKVNLTQGYTPDYEIDLNSGDPKAKPVERSVQNWLFYALTLNQQTWQRQGFCEWFSTMPNGYPKNAIVIRQRSDGFFYPYRSLIDGNVSDPLTTPAQWDYIQSTKELVANIPMPSGGPDGSGAELITSSVDFNSKLNGTWEVINDAVASGCQNLPADGNGVRRAGMLESKRWDSASSANQIVIQRYTTNTGIVFVRTSVNSVPGPWGRLTGEKDFMRFARGLTLTTNTTLSSDNIGNYIRWQPSPAANGQLVLPSRSTFYPGQTMWFINQSATTTLTLISAPGESIMRPDFQTASSIVLQPGDTAYIVASETPSRWDLFGGSLTMSYAQTWVPTQQTSEFSQKIASCAFTWNVARTRADPTSNFAARMSPARVLVGADVPTTPGVWQAEASTFTPHGYGTLLVTTNRNDLGVPLTGSAAPGSYVQMIFVGHGASKMYHRIVVDGNPSKDSGWIQELTTAGGDVSSLNVLNSFAAQTGVDVGNTIGAAGGAAIRFHTGGSSAVSTYDCQLYSTAGSNSIIARPYNNSTSKFGRFMVEGAGNHFMQFAVGYVTGSVDMGILLNCFGNGTRKNVLDFSVLGSDGTIKNALMTIEGDGNATNTAKLTVWGGIQTMASVTVGGAVYQPDGNIKGSLWGGNTILQWLNANVITNIRLGDMSRMPNYNGGEAMSASGQLTVGVGDFGADDGYGYQRPLQFQRPNDSAWYNIYST